MVYVPKRYILSLLGFFGMFSMYTTRLNINLAVLEMSSGQGKSSTGSNNETLYCPDNLNFMSSNNSTELIKEKENEFDWDKNQEMRLIGNYYYGYVAFHIISGILALKYGFKKVLLVSNTLG